MSITQCHILGQHVLNSFINLHYFGYCCCNKFPVVAVTNYRKGNGLKQHRFITNSKQKRSAGLSCFWRTYFLALHSLWTGCRHPSVQRILPSSKPTAERLQISFCLSFTPSVLPLSLPHPGLTSASVITPTSLTHLLPLFHKDLCDHTESTWIIQGNLLTSKSFTLSHPSSHLQHARLTHSQVWGIRMWTSFSAIILPATHIWKVKDKIWGK